MRPSELITLVSDGPSAPYLYHARCIWPKREFDCLKMATMEGEILEVRLPDKFLKSVKNFATANICATIGSQGTQA